MIFFFRKNILQETMQIRICYFILFCYFEEHIRFISERYEL